MHVENKVAIITGASSGTPPFFFFLFVPSAPTLFVKTRYSFFITPQTLS
jgi:NADP-dependent 3-hydroxy acid dehydrogenase YdfG